MILIQGSVSNAKSNAAYDGAGGDKISVVDALAIEQYLVGQVNAYFE